jgi:putative ABC transport system permease protein
MIWVALKMLVGERGRYISMIAGVFFSAMIITQQSSIFTGLMSRTYGFLRDTQLPDLWVVDPKVQFIDDAKPLQDTHLLRVRGISGVDWAVPMYRGHLRARLDNGTFQNCTVIGIDDATLIGGPASLVAGKIEDLRRADGVIVDVVAASRRLASPPKIPNGPRVPLKIGDTLELNDRRAVVVGLANITRTFQSNPVIYTTYSRATSFAPRERRLLSYILVKAKKDSNLKELQANITRLTGLSAYTNEEFSWVTVQYFLKNTGIPINFGIAVILGLVIGSAIVGQTFYSFTMDNIRYFGTLKAMGATNPQLLGMVVTQAAVVGSLGYGLGVGVASLFYFISLRSELAFRLIWQIPVISGVAVIFVCVLSAIISIRKVLTLEPAIVFRT